MLKTFRNADGTYGAIEYRKTDKGLVPVNCFLGAASADEARKAVHGKGLVFSPVI